MKRLLAPIAIGMIVGVAMIIGIIALWYTNDDRNQVPAGQPGETDGPDRLPGPATAVNATGSSPSQPGILGLHSRTTTPANAAGHHPADPQDAQTTDESRAPLPPGHDPLSPRPQPTGLFADRTSDVIYSINVSGLGAVDATPDMAIVAMAVTAKDPSVQAARQRAADLATHAIQTLVSLGVPQADINTSNFSISARYDYHDGQPYLTNYEVLHSITAKLRELDRVGSHIDSLSAAVGNDLAIHSLRFDFQDPTAVWNPKSASFPWSSAAAKPGAA